MKRKTFFRMMAVLVVCISILASSFVVVRAAGTLNTNLKNLKGISGEWTEEEGGLRGAAPNGGDVFAMSETEGTDFIYEAKTHRNEGVAFSLVFRSNASGSEAYVVNVDFTRNTARMFSFGSEGKGQEVIGEEYEIDADETDFALRVEAIGNTFRYYVNDVLAVSTTDDTYTSGFFGLLVFEGDGVFQDINQKPITTDKMPKLTGLSIKGFDSFDYKDDTFEYSVTLPADMTEINFVPKFEEGTEVSIMAYDTTENVVFQYTSIANDAESPKIPVTNSNTTVLVRIKTQESEVTKIIKVKNQAAATPKPVATPATPASSTPAANTPANTQSGTKTDDGNNLFVIIGIAAAVVIIAGAVVIVIIKKKKK